MKHHAFSTRGNPGRDTVGRRRRAAGWRWALQTVALATALGRAGFAYADATVEARGYWYCYDGTTQSTRPMAGARVELWDSDCLGSEVCDDLMAVGYVNDDGSYDIIGTGGDPGSFSWSRPDPYVRVVYTDDLGIEVVDELGSTRFADTPEHDHDDVAGLVDFGGFVAGADAGPGEGTQCGTYLAARDAYHDYLTISGGVAPPAGHFHVLYWSGVITGTPWTNRDTVHWPVGYGTWAMTHEFGHSVRHAFDGDDNEFALDAIRFRYARDHELCDGHNLADSQQVSLGFAFNEGWAEYWAGETGGCTPPPGVDDTIEGDVAREVERLSFCISPSTGGTIGKHGLLTVLQASPGVIHSFPELDARLRDVFPDVVCPSGISRSFTYLSKGLAVPAAIEWVDTGLDIMPASVLSITASGLWSNSGPPVLGPQGYAGTEYPGTLLASGDLASLIGRISGGPNADALFPVGQHLAEQTPRSGRLALSINDVPGTFADNQGAMNVTVSYQQPAKTIGVRAQDGWVDTGLVLERGAQVTIAAAGLWSNVAGPATLGPGGFVGKTWPGTVLGSADLGSLIGTIGGQAFPVGAHLSTTMPRAGRLYLGMNDVVGTFGDNQGALQVTIDYPGERPTSPDDRVLIAATAARVTESLESLEAELRDARTAAARATCDPADGCFAAAQAQARPALLAARIKLTKLEQARLAKSQRLATTVAASRASGTFDAWLAKTRATSYRKTAHVQRAALKKALSAAARLAGHTSSATGAAMLADDLRAKVASLDQLVRAGQPLPGNLQGAISGIEIPKAVDLVPTVRLTLQLTADGCDVGPGRGTVASLPAGLSCSTDSAGTCVATFRPGSAVTLTAASATGSRFTGFSGACIGTDCSVTLDADTIVTANFCRVIL